MKKGGIYRLLDEFHTLNILEFPVSGKERDGEAACNGIPYAINSQEFLSFTCCSPSQSGSGTIVLITCWYQGDDRPHLLHNISGFFRIVPANGECNFADIKFRCYLGCSQIPAVMFVSFQDLDDRVGV
jgi:hypothetical protein